MSKMFLDCLPVWRWMSSYCLSPAMTGIYRYAVRKMQSSRDWLSSRDWIRFGLPLAVVDMIPHLFPEVKHKFRFLFINICLATQLLFRYLCCNSRECPIGAVVSGCRPPRSEAEAVCSLFSHTQKPIKTPTFSPILARNTMLSSKKSRFIRIITDCTNSITTQHRLWLF